MKRAVFRSILFHVLFFLSTLVICVVYLPLLALPGRIFMIFIRFWVHMVTFLERHVLGLTYEVRGAENLPKDGPYIVAAKHQSAYETFKLHLLFDHPAIILKKELFHIPLWGLYLKKTDVIGIDRSTPAAALASIDKGILRVKEQGRPLVIFPQGTRVWPEETTADKPYKRGIARMQKLAGLPIVPMALNSGLFWPRRGWLRSPGKVIFEFFPPVAPGKEANALVAELENTIESGTLRLMAEAQDAALKREQNAKGPPLPLIILGAVFCAALYSASWFISANKASERFQGFFQMSAPPQASGFPGPVRLARAQGRFVKDDITVDAQDIRLRFWPLPWTRFHAEIGPFSLQHAHWDEPLVFDGLEARLSPRGKILVIERGHVAKQRFAADVTGRLDLTQKPYPAPDLTVGVEGLDVLLQELAQKKIIEKRAAMFTAAGFSAFAREGRVEFPLYQKGRGLYAGPLRILSLPETFD